MKRKFKRLVVRNNVDVEESVKLKNTALIAVHFPFSQFCIMIVSYFSGGITVIPGGFEIGADAAGFGVQIRFIMGIHKWGISVVALCPSLQCLIQCGQDTWCISLKLETRERLKIL